MESGLKTGMYYLRTKSAVDAIKFTVQKKQETKPTAESQPLTSDELKAMIAQAKASEEMIALCVALNLN